MSIRDFAGHLGISERMVSKWEAGGENIIPRPINQSALDSSLATSDPDVHARFAAMLQAAPLSVPRPAAAPDQPAAPAAERTVPVGDEHQIRHPIDGKAMALVKAGTFFSGNDNTPVDLPSFYIDVFPTTNADYLRFVEATGAKLPLHWQDGNPSAELLDHPIVFVTWHNANASAQWAGKALPTSHQWEKAGRGTRGDIYPWGNQCTPAKANCREHGIRSTTPVDTYASGVSPYGVYDMCGNVWEWCATPSPPAATNSKTAPSPARSSAAPPPPSTTPPTCTTTTPDSVASLIEN